MDQFAEPSALQVVGGLIMLAVVFVLRELTSGALKEVGKDAWGLVKIRRAPQPAKPITPRDMVTKSHVRLLILEWDATESSDDEAA